MKSTLCSRSFGRVHITLLCALITLLISLPGSVKANDTFLKIARSGNNMVVSWPSSLSQYTLAHSDTLSSQTWTAVISGITESAGTKSYTVATPATPRGSSPAPGGTVPQQPTVTGGTMDSGITKFGYKYDAISHGFQLLAKSTVSVEVRMERLDGGFGETNWSGMNSSTTPTYNYYRYYEPTPVGVGSVVPGRYRMSIRKSGETGAGWWAELYLLNESFPVYLSE